MDRNIVLSYTELVVMETLWEAKKPLTNPEIFELSGKSGWTGPKTINSITKRLVEKGMLKEGNVVKKSRGFAQEYLPALSAEEYLEKQITQNKGFQNDPNRVIPALFSSIISKENITDETLSELESIIGEYKNRSDR